MNSKRKSRFTIDEFGHTRPIDSEPERQKWLTGLFDDINKQNTKHYVREIFDICNFRFENEEYVLEVESSGQTWDIDKTKKVVGLNTGCGRQMDVKIMAD